MDPGGFNGIDGQPPDHKAAGVAEVVLPEPSPGGAGMAENPAVIEEKAEDCGEFGGDQGGDRHGQPQHLMQNIEGGNIKPGKK